MIGVQVKKVSVTLPDEDVVEHHYLELPEGVTFISGTRLGYRKLLVRSCYPVIFDQWWINSDESSRRDIVLGTPGTGKSMFLFYALYRLAQQGVKQVVFQFTNGSAALFEENAVRIYERGDRAITCALGSRDTVYLCDGAKKGDFSGCLGPYILTSSPNPDVYSRAKKDFPLEPFVSPVCTLSEMLAVRLLVFSEILGVETVLCIYSIGGGVLRLLEEAVNTLRKGSTIDFAQRFELLAAAANIDACRTAAEAGGSKGNQESHSLFHFVPDATNAREKTLKFGSEFIMNAFVKALLTKGRKKVVDFLVSSEALPGFPSLRGVLYEGFAMTMLQAGGNFKCCKLTNTGRGLEHTVPVQRAAEKTFRQLEDVTEISNKTHNRPLSGTFESVDSFISREWLFQITMASEHPVKITGLNKLLARLAEMGDSGAVARLFFVVPQQVYDAHYTECQKLLTKDGKACQNPGAAGKVEQYVMCVPITST